VINVKGNVACWWVIAAFVFTYIPFLIIHWIFWHWSWGVPAIISLVLGVLLSVIDVIKDYNNKRLEHEKKEKLENEKHNRLIYATEKGNLLAISGYKKQSEQYKRDYEKYERDYEIYEKADAEYKEKLDKMKKCWSELNEKVTQTAIEADEKLANLQLKGDKKKQIE